MYCPLRIIPILLIALSTFIILVKTKFISQLYFRLRLLNHDIYEFQFVKKEKANKEKDKKEENIKKCDKNYSFSSKETIDTDQSDIEKLHAS